MICIFIVYLSLDICLLAVAIASQTASGLVNDTGETGVEVPEAVTVEVEETHPLPEVSAITILIILIIILDVSVIFDISELIT